MKTPPHAHLIPAIRNWMLETFTVVHLRVDATLLEDSFLQDYQKDGIITLSVSPSAITGFDVVEGQVTFSARFNGRTHTAFVPATSVLGITAFNTADDTRAYYPLPPWSVSEIPKATKPTLSIVK